MSKEDNKLSVKVGDRIDVRMNFEPSTVKDLGDGAFQATVTTSDVDRMGESIDTTGITTDSYMQNPVVLYGHDYQGLPIGKTTKLSQFKNKLTATFQLAIKEYPFAQTVADMIKGGFLNAVSIGGVVKEISEDWTIIKALEMVEFSVVPVPANPNALITGRSLEQATGKTVDQISKEFHSFVEKSLSEKVKGLDTDELMQHIKTLEKLLAILKATASEKGSKNQKPTDEKITLTLRKTAGKVSQTGQDIIKLLPRSK